MTTNPAFMGASTRASGRAPLNRLLHRLFQRTAARFALVGLANTAIDFGIFVGLASAGLHVVPANTVSTSAGLLFSYFANRRFTFGVGGRHSVRGVLLFLGVTGVGLWVLQPLIIVGVTVLLPAALPAVVVSSIGKAAGIAVGLVWNFSLYRALVFRGTKA